ncbi:hypothetical protein EJB05_29444, partial [Eragrostis curvula]
ATPTCSSPSIPPPASPLCCGGGGFGIRPARGPWRGRQGAGAAGARECRGAGSVRAREAGKQSGAVRRIRGAATDAGNPGEQTGRSPWSSSHRRRQPRRAAASSDREGSELAAARPYRALTPAGSTSRAALDLYDLLPFEASRGFRSAMGFLARLPAMFFVAVLMTIAAFAIAVEYNDGAKRLYENHVKEFLEGCEFFFTWISLFYFVLP